MCMEVSDAVKRPIRRRRVFFGDLLVSLDCGLVIPPCRLFIDLDGLQPGRDDLQLRTARDAQAYPDGTGNEKVKVLPLPTSLSAHT